MSNIIKIEHVRARQASPDLVVGANLRVRALQERLESRKAEIDALTMRSLRVSSTDEKLLLVRQIVQIISDEIDGLAACQSGCSSCCRIPVALTDVEARVIGQEIGREVKQVAFGRELDRSLTGKACQFLRNNVCSIYESRPLTCRLQFNLDADSLLCSILPNEKINIPYFDGSQIEALWLYLNGGAENARMAGLHEFFGE
jgi:Fe-S-cluster containining protein